SLSSFCLFVCVLEFLVSGHALFLRPLASFFFSLPYFFFRNKRWKLLVRFAVERFFFFTSQQKYLFLIRPKASRHLSVLHLKLLLPFCWSRFLHNFSCYFFTVTSTLVCDFVHNF